jgi:hypothetical protein
MTDFRDFMWIQGSKYCLSEDCFCLQFYVGGPMSCLFCMCLFACGGVRLIALCFCFVCLHLVCHLLLVSLDCQFLITPSVFSNVYFLYTEAKKSTKTETFLYNYNYVLLINGSFKSIEIHWIMLNYLFLCRNLRLY